MVAREGMHQVPMVGVGKTNALLREAIDIRRLHPLVGLRVAADGAMRLVVSVDKQDVGPVCGKRAAGQQSQQNDSKQIHG